MKYFLSEDRSEEEFPTIDLDSSDEEVEHYLETTRVEYRAAFAEYIRDFE